MPRYHRSRHEDSYSSRSSESDDSKTRYKHKSHSRSSSKSELSSRRRKSYSRSPSRQSSSKRKTYKLKEERPRMKRSDSRSSSSKSRYNKHSSKKPSRKSSRSSSSNSSPSEITVSKAVIAQLKSRKTVDDTQIKIEKAIKAAEAAGLTLCKLPSYEYKEVEVKEEMPTIQDRNVLDELNSESFTQRQFTSSRVSKKIPENIVIDLNADTIKIPLDVNIPKSESLFHDEFFLDDATLKERWIKELLAFRRRAMRGETNYGESDRAF